MTLDQHSLAALIEQQMGGSMPAPEVARLHSVATDYFWIAVSDALRQSGRFSCVVASMPATASAAACDPTADFELV